MNLNDIHRRRAANLRSSLSEHGGRPKPGILSLIYPASDHGDNMKPVVKTPSSVPSSNDDNEEETGSDPEEGQPEVDEPGPSKTTSSSLPAAPGQSAMVPAAHKKTMLGLESDDKASAFVKRCASIIMGKEDYGSTQSEATSDRAGAGDRSRLRLLAAASKFNPVNKKPDNKKPESD